MSFQGIEAGKAFVEFLIKDDKLDSGLLKVADKLKQVGKIGLQVTGPIIAGFAAAAGVFASTGSELQDLHDRTGLSIESLSMLSFAAQQTGTDLGAIEKAAKELQKKGIDPLQFERMLADLAQIPDKTTRANKALELFGRRGVELVPMIEQFGQLRQDFDRLNLGMSGEQAAAADRLGDAWSGSRAQLTALMQQIGAAVAGPISDFLEFSQGIVSSVIEWAQQNPGLVRTIGLVALAIGAATAAAGTFGIVLSIITMHPIIAALSAIATIVLGIASYFGLASDGADSMTKKLNAIKQPSATQPSTLRGQALDTQRQLQAAMSGSPLASPTASPGGGLSASETAGGVGQLVSIATEELATLKEMLRFMQANRGPAGLLVGGF